MCFESNIYFYIIYFTLCILSLLLHPLWLLSAMLPNTLYMLYNNLYNQQLCDLLEYEISHQHILNNTSEVVIFAHLTLYKLNHYVRSHRSVSCMIRNRIHYFGLFVPLDIFKVISCCKTESMTNIGYNLIRKCLIT